MTDRVDELIAWLEQVAAGSKGAYEPGKLAEVSAALRSLRDERDALARVREWAERDWTIDECLGNSHTLAVVRDMQNQVLELLASPEGREGAAT